MKIITLGLQKIDAFQRRYRLTGFVYAVIKKYGEDAAGYQAALFTYYAFLSLFPLLLVLATLASIVARSHPGLQLHLIKSVTGYFPVLGDQLSAHIQTLHKSGLALIIGLLFMIYGARGVADAFRHGVNHIWQVPRNRRVGWPKSIVNSLGLIVVGGAGLLVAAILSGLASDGGHLLLFRLISLAVNLAMLFLLFTSLLNLSLPKHVTIRETRAGALTAAVGLVVLQLAGGYLLARELKNLDALSGYFALALGMLFWIYLQAQILYYAVEVAYVHSHKLWPRSLSGDHLTDADRQAAILHPPDSRVD